MTAEWGQISSGQVIDGKYRIVRLLGTGGMGAVYEGENSRIRRKVAIKMLHGSVSTQADVVKRFEREAQAAALVGSEHICEVLDLGQLPDGTRYMVMEYLDGETLTGRIKRHGRLSPAHSIPLLLQVLEALGAAHAAGIIHRDLKPDNIFILPQRSGMKDFIKILDFGVSKFSQLGGEEMNVTRAGAVVGTPYYMSPEQARGSSAIDARTDVYAIGVLLYQATTGQVPYQAETFNELLFKIVLEVAPPLQTYVPDLDQEFGGIVLKAMAREPADRFQSCAEFAAALNAYRDARAGSTAPMPPIVPAPQRPPSTQVIDMSGYQPPAAGGRVESGSRPNWQPILQPTEPMGPSPIHPNNAGPAWAQQSAAAAGQQHSPSAPGPGPNQAPWANQSASGQGPAPGVPTATSNSWGNASAVNGGAVAPPKSKSPAVAIAVGGAVVLGIAIGAGVFFFGGKKPATGQATGAETAQPTTTQIVPTAAPTVTATAAPVETAVATPTATASSTAASTAPSTKPTSTPVTSKTSKPATPTTGVVKTPPPPPGGKPKPKGGDLGY